MPVVRGGLEGHIVNCESDPGKLGNLSVSSYSPYSMRTIHYVPLGPLELRVSRTFLDQLRPQLSGHGYPTQRAATTSRPRSVRFWLLELRVSRTFLDQLRLQLFGPWIPNSMRCRYFLSALGPFLAVGTPRFSTFLNILRAICSGHGYPTRRDIDGGPR